MNETRRLPGGIRQLLEQALALVTELRDPQQAEEEVLVHLLDDLKSRVTDVLSVVRVSDFAEKPEVLRALKVADGILLYLDDPTQRDARGRLRDVEGLLREALG
jgi:hypothetical protein